MKQFVTTIKLIKNGYKLSLGTIINQFLHEIFKIDRQYYFPYPQKSISPRSDNEFNGCIDGSFASPNLT